MSVSDRIDLDQQFLQRLIAVIRDIREKIMKGVFKNEAQVSMGVVVRLLRELGWNTDDPKSVGAEHPIGSRRVDYALMQEPFGPVVLIEVKRVGRLREKGEDQLFDYCAKQGVPLAVLTDGKEWRFYYPGGMGTYEQRRFATVNLVEHDAAECACRLGRYLECRAVASGKAQSNVSTDYETHWKRIVVRKEFGSVLNSLVKEADPRFVALFRDEVERRCQIRPDEDVVREFLTTPPSLCPDTDGPPTGNGGPSITLDGETRRYRKRSELLVDVFSTLARRDLAFLERFDVAWGFRKRVARSRKELRPDRDSAFARLPGGWWIHIRCSNETAEKLVRKACEVAGVDRGPISW